MSGASAKPRLTMTNIDPARLALLNAGVAEASVLTECLAVDHAALMRAALPALGEEAASLMQQAAGDGISARMVRAGQLVHDRLGRGAIQRLGGHASDTVRGWACFAIGAEQTLSLIERLALIRPLADDSHFGVREWAWMAVRPHLVDDLDNAIAALVPWTVEPSERLRRFACEIIRPRGVWCRHIAALKAQPERALPVLDTLHADPSRYVQDSLGNWLNDAAKDRPDWVQDLCARWSAANASPATTYICRRALRSIREKTR